MGRALIAVGAALAVAFLIFGLVIYLTRQEDRVAVDNMLAESITRAIQLSEDQRQDVDLRTLARFAWDRVLVVEPGTARADVSRALGSEYDGDLPFGSSGTLFVFARGHALARFADYRGRGTFTGFERPLDVLPRARAVLAVRDLVVSPAREPSANATR